MKRTLWALLLVFSALVSRGQIVTTGDFNLIPGIDYEVGGITVSGTKDLKTLNLLTRT